MAMLISQVLEKTAKTTAAENMAYRLADKVRNIWLEKFHAGIENGKKTFMRIQTG